MILRLLAPLALFLTPGLAAAAPVTADDLLRHVEILASDAFEGREPGTEGEKKTLNYISERLGAFGLEPAAADGSWYQPVPLVLRTPIGAKAKWMGRDGNLSLGEEEIILVGARAEERIRRAPLVFAGHGAVLPRHGIDQLSGAPIDGAVVLIVYEAPDIADFPSFSERAAEVTRRGASAVIGIMSERMAWPMIQQLYGRGRTRLVSDRVPPVQGVVSQAAAERLLAAAGTSLERLLNGATGPEFKAVPLAMKADLEVRSDVGAFTSHNVVGRLKGKGDSGQSLLFLGHWDHFGICRPEGVPDRVCNGAVDNASGIASLLEIARGLATGARPERDILVLATTAEEIGLLGAEHFAANPVVPLDSIVAAFNLDTVAISPKGTKVAVIGGGIAGIDALIDETVREAGRERDRDSEADEFIDRQDGWELRKLGVPAMMVGGSFSDMGDLGRFLSGPYHEPEDDLKRPIELGGAAEDAELQIMLARKLADPERYQPRAAAPPATD